MGEGVQVLAHNAAKAPNTPTGAYRWHIGGLDDPVPFMTVRLATVQPEPEPPAAAKQPEAVAPKKKGHK